MWIATLDGFYSAVAHDAEHLVVRTRTKADARKLRKRLAEMGTDVSVQRTPTRDYGWRLIVPRAAFGDYLADTAVGVDYGNFKEAVRVRVGAARAHIYGEVWWELLALQRRVRTYLPPRLRAWDEEPEWMEEGIS